MSIHLIQNIRLAADMSRLMLLIGERQYDRFVISDDTAGPPRLVPLEGVLRAAFPDHPAITVYDPATGQLETSGQAPRTVAANELIATLADPSLLLVNAELLFEDATQPRDDDLALLRALERFARTESGRRFIVLRAPNLRALPQTLTASPSVRTVSLPAAGREERTAYGRLRGARLAERSGMEREALAVTLGNASDGWRLTEIEKLIHSLENQPGLLSASTIEATARAQRIGVSSSPWSGDTLRQAIREAPERLARRVRGQPAAIDAMSSALRKAQSGLAGAHQGELSRGPQGQMFFCGPTGTGKTEMAKAVAELVFGDEDAIIRFDCAELRADHTVARLIGAPPGYVGHESGGELTERVRARPQSVVLFDEIEKAHPRLLDIFLSILDDGRLSDGHGVCTRFNECILIFTSNLGIYTEVDDGHGRVTRRPRFGLEASYDEIAAEVRSALREEFITRLGRPELFGRLGGESAIIVFDYIRDLSGVTEKFLNNVAARVRQLHGVTLEIAPEVVAYLVARSSTSETLALGARGIAQMIQNDFCTRLADFLFVSDNLPARLQVGLRDETVCFG